MASAQNYTLGRGTLNFARFLAGTQTPEGFRYIGNTPTINMTSDSENLDHYSSDQGLREKDESVLMQLDRTGAFETDSVRPENIALLLLGDVSDIIVSAATAVVTTVAAAVQGRTYQLGATLANPVGSRLVSAVVATLTGTPATVYVPGVDYVVDLKSGLVTIMDGGAIDGTSVNFTFNVGASERTTIISGSSLVEGSLMYKSANPVGLQFDYLWPWVKLTPNGDFELKGDEWQTLPFNFEVLKKENLAAVYVNGEARSTAG